MKKQTMKPLSAEEFISIWQTAANRQEFAAKTGMEYETAYQRARNYRRHGVKLRRFEDIEHVLRRRNDWAGLAQLASSLAPPPLPAAPAEVPPPHVFTP